MLFTIPEQKKIAKFFQCLDELLQPHIISVSEDNKDYNYQLGLAPTLWTLTGLNLNLTMVEVSLQSISISYNFHSLPRPAGSCWTTAAAAAACVTQTGALKFLDSDGGSRCC